jgi:hypothetical protein
VDTRHLLYCLGICLKLLKLASVTLIFFFKESYLIAQRFGLLIELIALQQAVRVEETYDKKEQKAGPKELVAPYFSYPIFFVLIHILCAFTSLGKDTTYIQNHILLQRKIGHKNREYFLISYPKTGPSEDKAGYFQKKITTSPLV